MNSKLDSLPVFDMVGECPAGNCAVNWQVEGRGMRWKGARRDKKRERGRNRRKGGRNKEGEKKASNPQQRQEVSSSRPQVALTASQAADTEGAHSGKTAGAVELHLHLCRTNRHR
jgi:hypothetical protein